MEIELNEEQNKNNETSDQFVNFSIREYVAEICKKDWKKCWPFGSLGDPSKLDNVSASEFIDSRTFLSSQNHPEDNDANDMIASREIDEKIIDEGAKIGSNVAADHGELGRNRTRRKPQKFLLLSDILRELAGPSGGFHVHCDITNADNVNTRFATETDDESDDHLTLDSFFRKQKGIEVKRKLKPGFKDSRGNDLDVGPRSCSRKMRIDDVDIQTVVKRKKCSPEVRPLSSSEKNGFRKQKDTETVDEDSEMEAVMLLARHFNEPKNPSIPGGPGHGSKRAQTVQSTNPSAEPGHGQRFTNVNILNKNTKPVCACVQKKIQESLTHKDPVLNADTHKKFTKEKLADTLFSVSMVCQPHMEIYMMKAQMGATQTCLINRNPADFTIPCAGNKFMRGG